MNLSSMKDRFKKYKYIILQDILFCILNFIEYYYQAYSLQGVDSISKCVS